MNSKAHKPKTLPPIIQDTDPIALALDYFEESHKDEMMNKHHGDAPKNGPSPTHCTYCRAIKDARAFNSERGVFPRTAQGTFRLIHALADSGGGLFPNFRKLFRTIQDLSSLSLEERVKDLVRIFADPKTKLRHGKKSKT